MASLSLLALRLLPLLHLLTVAVEPVAGWSDVFRDGLPATDNDDVVAENAFERPCRDLVPRSAAIDLPCLCSSGSDNGTYINCDRVVFAGDLPVLPHRQAIHGFSQRWASYQSFPSQLFTASDVPLKRLDLSHNGVVLITDKLFDGLADTIEDINFGWNLLGDQLNPIFATAEFQNMRQLKRLDLSGNDLKALDDSLLLGCDKLQVSSPSGPCPISVFPVRRQ